MSIVIVYRLEVWHAPSREWINAALPASKDYITLYQNYRRLIDNATDGASQNQAPLGYRIVGNGVIWDVWTNGKVHP